jgi:hypothetical protein
MSRCKFSCLINFQQIFFICKQIVVLFTQSTCALVLATVLVQYWLWGLPASLHAEFAGGVGKQRVSASVRCRVSRTM